MEWKQYWNSHNLVTGGVQVVDVRLLWLSEKDVGGLCLGSVVSCCMLGDFL